MLVTVVWVRGMRMRVGQILMHVLVSMTCSFGIPSHVNMLVMRVVMPMAVCVSKLSMDVLVLVLLPRKQHGC